MFSSVFYSRIKNIRISNEENIILIIDSEMKQHYKF